MFFSQPEIISILGNKAKEKTSYSFTKLFLLSILGGAFIALGFLGFVRVSGTFPPEWGSFGNFIGALIFPIGLMSIVFFGGELITGNMMTMTFGLLEKKITLRDLLWNWLVVLVGNIAGGMLIAWFFGHYVGMTENAFLTRTVAVAQAKVADAPMVALASAIGCNIFVCMAVLFATGAKDSTSKLASIWIPIVVFVVIGFQHVAANAFIIPAAIFTGTTEITWMQFMENTIFVFIGNTIGGSLLFAVPYFILYAPKTKVAIAKTAFSETTIEETPVL